MQVELSEPAENDLMQIARYIAADSPDRALSYCAELESACLELGEYPQRGPVLKEQNGFEIRRLVHGKFVVLYQIEESGVHILRIIHGARNIEAILLGDDEPDDPGNKHNT